MSSPMPPAVPGPREITTQTEGKTEGPSDLRVGTVKAVSAQGITVTVASGDIIAAHLDSYSPTVGDAVALMKAQDSWLVLGRAIGPGTRVATDLTGPGPTATGSTLAGLVTAGDGTVMASSAVGVTVDVSKLDLNYYHPVGHHVLCSLGFNWTASAANTGLVVDVWENTIASPVQISQLVITSAGAASRTNWINIQCVLAANTYGGAPRNINVAVTSQTAGTVTVTDSSRRAYLFVQDLGHTSFIPQK